MTVSTLISISVAKLANIFHSTKHYIIFLKFFFIFIPYL